MPRLSGWLRDLLPRHRRALALVLGFAAIETIYVFFVSAGHFTHWPTYLGFIDDLADGFRAGHLHLAIEPPAALVAKANPFDPAWKPLWYWDASLYRGHYYLYWGPVPALVLAGWKTLFRVHGHVGDQVAVFALASVQALAGLLLIDRMQRRLFPALPGLYVALGVAVFVFVNPTLYNLSRAGVYEAAIVGGHAFLVAGLLFAFEAISVVGRQRSRLALAGACWALALGCRASIAPAIPLLVAVTCWLAAPRGGDPARWRLRAQALAWLGAPIAAGCCLLLTYNRLRFDAWFDFGRHYQLTWIAFSSSREFLLANAWSYALRPAALGCRFPFLTGVTGMGAAAFPGWLRPPAGYIVYEPVVGCLIAMPWAWLAPVAAVAGTRRLWALARGRAPATTTGAEGVALTWLCAATTLATVGSFLVPLSLFWATMRFLGDATPALTLVGTLGWWLCREGARERPWLRRAIAAGAVAAALATVLAGAALGFEGQYRHFRQHNPALLDRLEKALSFC
ncbi:MAG TPA: hypothetical protein VIF57_14330 [Polyangia bacterium]